MLRTFAESGREETNTFFKKRQSKTPVPTYTSTNTALITSQFFVWTFFFFFSNHRKFFKVPNSDAQMYYVSDLEVCQSFVTLSADLPAVAQGLVRGAGAGREKRGGLREISQPCPSPLVPPWGRCMDYPQAIGVHWAT